MDQRDGARLSLFHATPADAGRLVRAAVAGLVAGDECARDVFCRARASVFLFGPQASAAGRGRWYRALQVLIALTGNYGFFNLLTLALCLLAMDDAVWRNGLARGRRRRSAVRRPRASCPNAPPCRGCFIFLLSLVPLASSFRRPIPVLAPCLRLSIGCAISHDQWLWAFCSDDQGAQGNRRPGIGRWGDLEDLCFSFQAGGSAPRAGWVAPYMPRLDWQMWFAALGSVEENPWFLHFLERLLATRLP